MRELANTFNADTKVIIDTSTDINFDQTIRKRRKEAKQLVSQCQLLLVVLVKSP